MAASSAENTIQNMYQGRKKHSSGRWEKRHVRGKARAGVFIRDFTEIQNFYDEEDSLVFQWTPRGKLLTNARYMKDWEFFDDRSRHSTGWKEHKIEHQWEHRRREKEKHQKKHNRKAFHQNKHANGKPLIEVSYERIQNHHRAREKTSVKSQMAEAFCDRIN